jgi:hypothetical protein
MYYYYLLRIHSRLDELIAYVIRYCDNLVRKQAGCPPVEQFLVEDRRMQVRDFPMLCVNHRNPKAFGRQPSRQTRMGVHYVWFEAFQESEQFHSKGERKRYVFAAYRHPFNSNGVENVPKTTVWASNDNVYIIESGLRNKVDQVTPSPAYVSIRYYM